MVEEVEVGSENDETSVDETVGTRRVEFDLERRLVEAGGVRDRGVGTVGGDPGRRDGGRETGVSLVSTEGERMGESRKLE